MSTPFDDELRSMQEEEAFASFRRSPSPDVATAPRPRRKVRHPPENQERLAYALDRGFRAYRRLMRETLFELGLHPAQEGLLTEIYFAEGSPTQAEYAARLGCSRQTVTRSIRRLCRAGLLEANTHHQDERQDLVLLTELGEGVMRVTGGALRSVEAELAAEFDERERAVLWRALSRLDDIVDAILRERRAPPPPLR